MVDNELLKNKDLLIKSWVCGTLGVNCYLAGSLEKKEVVLIDPVLDHFLKKNDPAQSPELLIRKKWIKEGYRIQTISSDSTKSNPHSLRALPLRDPL